MNVAVVHYAYLTGEWEPKLRLQLDRYQASGLLDYCKNFYLVVTDTNNNPALIESLVQNYNNITLEYYSNNNLFEYYSISRIKNLVEEDPNLAILYFMLKGNTNNSYRNISKKILSLEKKQSVDSFVEMLEYILIDQWRSCLQKIQEGYDIVGVNKVHAQWYGNCWWSQSKYLQYNEKLTFNPESDSRWKCELWLMMSNPRHSLPSTKFYEFFSFWADNYYTSFPKFLYDNTDRKTLKFRVIKAYYGYFAEAQHEISPLRGDLNIVYDVTEDLQTIFDQYCEDKIKLKISYDEMFDDKYIHHDKRLKIYYSVNIDPTNVYVMSSLPTTKEIEAGKIEI